MAQHDMITTMREQMQRHVARSSYHQIPEPEKSEGEVPVEPNAFADGSMQQPNRRYMHLGAYGVWWPRRNLKEEPLAKGEAEFATT